jgi:hypothetical protein
MLEPHSLQNFEPNGRLFPQLGQEIVLLFSTAARLEFDETNCFRLVWPSLEGGFCRLLSMYATPTTTAPTTTNAIRKSVFPDCSEGGSTVVEWALIHEVKPRLFDTPEGRLRISCGGTIA